MTGHQSVVDVARVAMRLGPLKDEVVFVGGCAVPLLISRNARPTVRPTDDVDCVVDARRLSEYHRLGERLRELGFHECRDEGAPLCRWVVDGIRVDIMPTNEAVLGFRNRWYQHAVEDPHEVELEPGITVKVARLPVFLATKFDALADRGGGDFVADPDFEDIVTVVAHREDAPDLVLGSAPPVRSYLARQFRGLVARSDLADLVSGCLDGDHVSQAAVPRVLDAFQRMAEAEHAKEEPLRLD